MKRHMSSLVLGLCVIACAYSQQAGTEPPANGPLPPYERLLEGDDARRAEELQRQIDTLADADDYLGAIAAAEELLTLRVKAQGADHYEAVNAKHVLTVLGKVAVLEAAKRREWQLALRWESEAAQLEAQAQYAQALAIRQDILRIRRTVLGEEHLQTATSYNNVGFNLYAQGKAAEAASFLHKALEIFRKVLGEEHPITANSYNHVAANLDAQGKADEAAPLFQKALEINSRVLGEEHLATAMSFHNVAAMLRLHGKAAEAEPLFHKALEINRKVLGEEHLHTAHTYDGVASNLGAQGKAAEAAPHYQKALEIRRRVHGEEHPDTTISYFNLAANLNAQGKAAEAAPLHQKALEIRRKVFGEMHPYTATSYNSIAGNLHDEGKTTEAAPLFHKALEIRRKVHGEEHPDTANSYNSVAGYLHDQGKIAEAAPLFHKALEIRRKVHGEEHPDTANSYNNLASNLYAQGKAAEAAPLLQKALAICRKVLGEEHPDTAASYNEVAVNLNDQGKTAEAAPLFEKALEIRRKLLGEEHPDTARSYNVFAYNLHAQGKAAEAEAVLRRALFAYEASRLSGAAGIDRALLRMTNPRLLLAVVEQSHAPDQAWHNLESTLARGLLDEQSRGQHRLSPAEESERDHWRDRLAAAQGEILFLVSRSNRTPAEQSRLESLLAQRQEASAGLATLAVAASAREVASGEAIQTALPEHAALLLWVDVSGISGSVQEHWACVVRRQGSARWERLAGTGADGKWTKSDSELPARLRDALGSAHATASEIAALTSQLRAQRLAPVAKHLTDVKTLYVVPVHEMAGLPVELIAPEFQVEYVTSGTAIVRARERPKFTGRDAMLAVGDPVFPPAEPYQEPPLPPHGVLVVNVVPGGAAENKIFDGDVLLSYGDVELQDYETLRQALAAKSEQISIPVQLWRVTEDGQAITKTVDLAPGRLGANLAREPARALLAARHQNELLLAASSRSGRIDEQTGQKRPWQELPGTAVELARLHQAFGEQATVITRSQASEQTLEELRKHDQLRNYRYLHFATHGLANPTHAFESFLVLAQDNLPEYHARPGEKYFNGELSAREVMDGWKLDADLVTLSACESGLGKTGGGDGLLGFTQAFLLAGARNVCLSPIRRPRA